MSIFKRACSGIKNKLFVDGVEIDLTNKRAILTRNPIAGWDNGDIVYLTDPPGKIFIYDDNICMLSNNKVKRFNSDNNDWETYIQELRYCTYSGVAIIDDEIHIFGGFDKAYRKQHYKYDKTSSTWVSVSTLPYEFYNGSVEYVNGEIHLIGGGPSATTKKSHWAFKDGKWIKRAGIANNLYGYNFSFVYNGEIHLIQSYIFNKKKKIYKTMHVKYDSDGNSWIGSREIRINSSYLNSVRSSIVYGIGTAKDGSFLLLTYMNYYLDSYEPVAIDPPINKVYIGSLSDMVMTEFSNMPISSYISTPEGALQTLINIQYLGGWFIFNEDSENNVAKNSISYSLNLEDK